MRKDDHYEVLGVSRQSDEVVIRAAYKAMMLKYHPDTNGKSDAEERAKAINESFAVLGNAIDRRNYDATLLAQDDIGVSSPAPPPPPPPPPPPRPRPDAVTRSPEGRERVHGNDNDKPGKLVIGALLFATAIGALLIMNSVGTGDVQDGKIALPVSEPQSTPTSNEVSSNGLDESAIEPAQIIPTVGEFNEKVHIAMNDFLNTVTKGGISGAETYSRNCQSNALKSNDILETDYCIAFDMSAMAFDLGNVDAKKSSYFKLRAKNLDADYERFTQASPNRTQLIWAEVGSAAEMLIQSPSERPPR